MVRARTGGTIDTIGSGHGFFYAPKPDWSQFGGPHPELTHEVTPGVDTDFIPNGMMRYNP